MSNSSYFMWHQKYINDWIKKRNIEGLMTQDKKQPNVHSKKLDPKSLSHFDFSIPQHIYNIEKHQELTTKNIVASIVKLLYCTSSKSKSRMDQYQLHYQLMNASNW